MINRTKDIPLPEMLPRDWLAYMRNKYKPDGPFIINKSNLEDLLSHVPASSREEARKIWQNRHGMSMYTIIDELMETYLQQIDIGLTDLERQIVQNTLFAVLPTYEFNGYTGFTPRGDRVVIFHLGLGSLLDFWSHWYLRLHKEGNAYVTGDPDRLFTILRYFSKAWYGIPPGSETPDVYPSSEDAWVLDEAMTRGAISFVLGHEMGHILFEHRPYGFDMGNNHAMEFEADRKGLEIVIRMAVFSTEVLKKDNYFTKFILFGPLFAIAVMSLFGDSSSATHPSPSSRKDHLLSAYEPLLKTLLNEKYNIIVPWIDENLVTMLGNNVNNLFFLFSEFRTMIEKSFMDMPSIDTSWIGSEIQLNNPP